MIDMPDDVPVTCEGDCFVLVNYGGHVVPLVLRALNDDGVVPSREDHWVDAWLLIDCHPLRFGPVVVCAPGEELSY